MTDYDEINILRFNNTFDDLIEETENRATLTDRRKNDRLKDALALMEYLAGERDTSPIDEWFN